jgi:hypothetical protein
MTYEIRNRGCSRRYEIDGKEIISVAFYNEQGIVMQTDHGWLEKCEPNSTYQRDVNPLVLDKMPIRKMKADFAAMYALKQPFYTKGKVVRKYWESDIGYILYIPYITNHWSATFEYSDHGASRSEFCRYSHQIEGYKISIYVRDIPLVENAEFIRKVREIFELAVYHKNEISDSSIIENKERIIESIKRFQAAEPVKA